ncbi:hypothetical protein BBO99_00009382 [Phytophthora kernoviae]|uniref:Uncharacterized protein n=1 Tax=Phytophthora kernoviae TaxID=325452 RepID=A0A3R7JUL7_9STRA|nr:hypothetical protein BBI17_009406 [Phytophthora kernoviae]RLN73507.1 hypothetical protein BBO99_00009382 [Phytophthora kernoviae]
MLTGSLLLSAIGLAGLASRADAHGYLKEPKPSWNDEDGNAGWITQIENYWDIRSGGDQVGKFKTMAAEKGMSVKDVVLDMVGSQTCGNTLPDGDPQPIPSDGKAKWWGSGGGGFTHTGPCEVYINDKMVLHGDDCEDEYPGGPDGSNKMSEMPIDYSSCNGDCTLTIYWLAFQNAQWQAYINCVPLKGSGSSTQTQTQSSAGSSTEDQSKEETPSTETQSTEVPSTEAPSTDAPSTETQSEETPASTEAPESVAQEAPSPETPSTGTDTKCTAARRLRKKTSTL